MPGGLGFVSTEGGPLLIADREVVGRWSGADGPDFDAACDHLEAVFGEDEQAVGLVAEVALGDATGVLWDLPPGIVEVDRRDGDVVMVESSDSGAQVPAREPDREVVVEVTSGFVVVLWSTESGAEATADGPRDGRPLHLSVQEAGIELACEPGTYVVAARRRTGDEPACCWLTPGGR